MTLAMTLGMSIGVRSTLWMMWGELLGVGTVAILSVIGVSALMLKMPLLFDLLKLFGAAYLITVGINMWRSKGKLSVSSDSFKSQIVSKTHLFNQGLVTAITNPKGWAFMVSLLPPFINTNYALPPQLAALVLVILCSEFICMMLYAAGGKSIGKILTKRNNVRWINKISGVLMICVAIWLALS
jgi:homoserine/homoserine lactone efflux protein